MCADISVRVQLQVPPQACGLPLPSPDRGDGKDATSVNGKGLFVDVVVPVTMGSCTGTGGCVRWRSHATACSASAAAHGRGGSVALEAASHKRACVTSHGGFGLFI